MDTRKTILKIYSVLARSLPSVEETHEIHNCLSSFKNTLTKSGSGDPHL